MHYVILDPTWKPLGLSAESLLPFSAFNFPAGEAQIKLGEFPPKGDPRITQPWDITIAHRTATGEGLFQLILAADAVRNRYWNAPLAAYLPYLPQARQDRLMVSGEPFGLRLVIEMIARAGFKELNVLDPHNPEVTGALCAAYGMRLREVPFDLLGKAVADLDPSRIVLVSPDAGASKKITKQAKEIEYFGPIFQGEKVRDLRTGHIERYEVYGPLDQLKGKTAIIRDDICSKGGTFKLLAKSLKEKGAERVVLVVSHWENTAYRRELFEAGIDHVYTTNSLADLDPNESVRDWVNDFLTQYPL